MGDERLKKSNIPSYNYYLTDFVLLLEITEKKFCAIVTVHIL